MDWDGYTAFSVISGIALIGVGVFARGVTVGDRAWCIVGGLLFGGYGIYVAAQTSGTYYFPVWIFVVPFLVGGLVVYRAFTGAAERHREDSAPSPASAPTPPSAPTGQIRVPEPTVSGHDELGDGVPAAPTDVWASPAAAVAMDVAPSRLMGQDRSRASDLSDAPSPKPHPMIEIATGASTNVGLVRKVNEDSLLCDRPVFLVADGMGGYSAGDVASAIVIEEFAKASGSDAVTPEWVRGSFARADERIRGGVGGGTTVSGAAIVRQQGEPYWLVFNIGDSRVYHCANGEVNQLTVDHSVVQELVDAGELPPERARFHPQRHIITRAIGAPEAIQPDFWLIPIAGGDRLMMCSDGLTSEVGDDRIGDQLLSAADPQQAAEGLVAAALAAGGKDNVTTVVVDVLSVDGRIDEVPVDSRTVPRGHAVNDDSENTVPRGGTSALTATEV